MLSNINDVNMAINTLTKEGKAYPVLFNEKMSADEYNYNIAAIKSQLDLLYKKIRTLQELNEFCISYVNDQLDTKTKQFKEKLKIIRETVDTYLEPGCVSQLIKFSSSLETVKDRDMSELPKMETTNSGLMAAATTLSKARINTAANSSIYPCYSNSYDNLKKELPGSSCYLSQETYNGGVVETAIFSLKTPQEINYIEVEPINCDIEKIELINPENIIENEVAANSFIYPPKNISAIKLTLRSGQYSERLKYVDSNAYQQINFGRENKTHVKPKESVKIKNLEEQNNVRKIKYDSKTTSLLSKYVDKLNENINKKNNLAAIRHGL